MLLVEDVRIGHLGKFGHGLIRELKDTALMCPTTAKSFNVFEAPFEATPQTCTITRLTAGNINPTYQLTYTQTGQKFVVQLVNAIFRPAAVDNNLRLLELAQAKAREQGILPKNWEDVHYANVKGSTSKIHTDGDGNAWRVMKFIEYDESTGENIYNAFGYIPARDRWDAARSLGEATATFAAMLGALTPEDIAGGLKPWQSPLPGFHVHPYYRDWLFAVRDGKVVPRHLSRGAELPEIDPSEPDAVSKDDTVIATYPDGHSRVAALMVEGRLD